MRHALLVLIRCRISVWSAITEARVGRSGPAEHHQRVGLEERQSGGHRQRAFRSGERSRRSRACVPRVQSQVNGAMRMGHPVGIDVIVKCDACVECSDVQFHPCQGDRDRLHLDGVDDVGKIQCSTEGRFLSQSCQNCHFLSRSHSVFVSPGFRRPVSRVQTQHCGELRRETHQVLDDQR